MSSPSARGRARQWAVLALVVAGCGAGRCGGPAPAAGAGLLGEQERRNLPGAIAFVSERAGQKDVWLVRPTGEEVALAQGPEDEYPGAPAPGGGGLLVVAAWEAQGLHQQQIRWVPLEEGGKGGGEAAGLHAPRARARNVSWAPDGSWFVAESDAESFSDVVRQAPRAGAEPVRLSPVPEGNFEPAVSPDGRQVAFVSSRTGDPEVYLMAADGTQVRRLTHFHREDTQPRWSPDGRWLSFLSDREGRQRVYVVRPDGTDLRALSGSAATGEEREPAWSPDGKRLAFVARREGEQARVWVASLEGGEPVALTDGRSTDDMPAWSPQGQHLAFVSDRTGDVELFLMRVDGSAQTQLTHSKGPDWLPMWFVPR